MSYYEEVTKDLDATIKILSGIAKDLKAWKPEKHELNRNDKCKNKRCKANLSL